MMRRCLIIFLLLLPVSGFTAYPVIEDYTSNNSAGDDVTSLKLGKPAGVQNGDLLLLIAGNDAAEAFTTFNVIAGWTDFGSYGDGNTYCKLIFYRRIANGTEGDSVEITMTTNDEVWGWYIRISNIDETTPINDIGTPLLNASEEVHEITQVTSDVDSCLIIYALAFDGGDGYPFSESNTGWLEEDEQQAGSGQADASGCWGVKALVSAGGAGTVTITSTEGDGAVAVQVAIAPAGEAPPPAELTGRRRKIIMENN